jgi:hypothetical protein
MVAVAPEREQWAYRPDCCRSCRCQ